MNRDPFEEKIWQAIKGKIQEKWRKFTHDDLSDIRGNYTRLVDRLKEKYKYTQEQAENEVEEWKRKANVDQILDRKHNSPKPKYSDEESPPSLFEEPKEDHDSERKRNFPHDKKKKAS